MSDSKTGSPSQIPARLNLAVIANISTNLQHPRLMPAAKEPPDIDEILGRKRKRVPSTKSSVFKIPKLLDRMTKQHLKADVSCQTSGWKFMSEIGTIENKKLGEAQISKSVLVADFRKVMKTISEEINCNISCGIDINFRKFMRDSTEKIVMWYERYRNGNHRTCLLCEQQLPQQQAIRGIKHHLVTSCPTVTRLLEEMVIGGLHNQPARRDEEEEEEEENMGYDPQHLFTSEYLFQNSPEDLQHRCFFCGMPMSAGETTRGDTHIDRKHLFDSCMVFKAFLRFLQNPIVVGMTAKIGTSWTFFFYHTYLVYFTMGFKHPISDLAFLKEDQSQLIMKSLEVIVKNITLQMTSCPLCYAAITTPMVLEHHLKFGLCPILTVLADEVKKHVAQVWREEPQVHFLRRISAMYQFSMKYQAFRKPISMKQSIIPVEQCQELLQNAMHFKSLDNNYYLQLGKTPRDPGVAQLVESLQNTWAQKLLPVANRNACPFCETNFNHERNLLRHIMYISCKSLRPLCNKIYQLVDLVDWDVTRKGGEEEEGEEASGGSTVTHHTNYILKECFLAGHLTIAMSRDQLAEYVAMVTEKFLTSNITDDQRKALFESSGDPNGPKDDIFNMFYDWARKVTKKKTSTNCTMCEGDLGSYPLLLDHLALGVCPYLKTILSIIDEIYKHNQLNVPCNIPPNTLLCRSREVSFDIVHHIRKMIFIYRAVHKPEPSNPSATTTTEDGKKFETFIINHPDHFLRHQQFVLMLLDEGTTSCPYCFTELASYKLLLVHMLYFKCPTFKFTISLVEEEFVACTRTNVPLDRMVELIRYYTRVFELDPSIVFSSSYMKKYFFLSSNNPGMLESIRQINLWAQDTCVFDKDSNLKICRACRVAAENVERHSWLEEPSKDFCSELKKYLAFHRKTVCKRYGTEGIKASFTSTDLFDLKRYLQFHRMGINSNVEYIQSPRHTMLSSKIHTDLANSIRAVLEACPRFVVGLEAIQHMSTVDGSFIRKQFQLSKCLVMHRTCFLCDLILPSKHDVRNHVVTFECPVIQKLVRDTQDNNQVSEDTRKEEVILGYKRTVSYCREKYPNIVEGNLLMLMEVVNPECHEKLLNVIMNRFPKVNPFRCSLCGDNFNTKGQLYTHYHKLQCFGVRHCLSCVPNKRPDPSTTSPFLEVLYNIFAACYTMYNARSSTDVKAILENYTTIIANKFDFWCRQYCDSLVPQCPFCGTALVSLNWIRKHPKQCPRLKSINLEIFNSERGSESVYLKQRGLGSQKVSGKLPVVVEDMPPNIPFMQEHRCSAYDGWITLCQDCAQSLEEETEDTNEEEVTCRFLMFRRLIKRDNRLSAIDFESSQTVADLGSWESKGLGIPDLDPSSAKYILEHLLPHYNQIMSLEFWEMESARNLSLKHQVNNMRELCDSCSTTLFNVHLFCPRCGFVLCMDCYRDRLSATEELSRAVTEVMQKHCISVALMPRLTDENPNDAPHDIICHGHVLALHHGDHPLNNAIFQRYHQKGNATVVYNLLSNVDPDLWTPENFSKHFGNEKERVVNTSTLDVHRVLLKDFWDGFENVNERPRNENGDPMVLKLKDWPTTWDFREKLPQWYRNFMEVIPLKDYTLREGKFNIARYLPNIYCTPDLGPKMYIAYSNANNPNEGSTVLHIDISDAANIIMYVGESQDVVINYDKDAEEEDANSNPNQSFYLKRKVYTLREICEDVDELQLERIRRDRCKVGALWHIFHPNDIDKIRHFIKKVQSERGIVEAPGSDPIHDQTMYLDRKLRKRLSQEYNVRGWAIAQCEGDAVMIPAGAPHQVRNLQSCIKIAEDYVSPERVSYCLMHTEEIRHLSKTHYNHEDKLQVKNLIYHTVKECVGVLQGSPTTRGKCSCTDHDVVSVECQTDLNLSEACQLRRQLEECKMDHLRDEQRRKNLLEATERKLKRCKAENEMLKLRYGQEREKRMWKYKEQCEAAANKAASCSGKGVLSKPTSITVAQYQQRENEKLAKGSRPSITASSSTSSSASSSTSVEPTVPSILSQTLPPESSLPYGRAPPQLHVTVQASPSDPRLKSRHDPDYVAEQVQKTKYNTPLERIPKSAFLGVQNAVEDLRKKQPPPQTLRRAPETPEPMDTNQDSCSPKPSTSTGGLYRQFSNSSLKSSRPYDQSNSETDSNEDLTNVNLDYSQYTPYPQKGPLIREQASPSVSPGFQPKALNLQISSPKQPGIFKNTDFLSSNSPSFIRTDYSTTTPKNIKTEQRSQSFAPQLSSYLPEHLIPNLYDSSSQGPWGLNNPRRSTQSPVTPTMSPVVPTSRTPIPSPATPSPPPTCKSLVKPTPIVSDNSPFERRGPTSSSSLSSQVAIMSHRITPRLEIRKSTISLSSCNRLRLVYPLHRTYTSFEEEPSQRSQTEERSRSTSGSSESLLPLETEEEEEQQGKPESRDIKVEKVEEVVEGGRYLANFTDTSTSAQSTDHTPTEVGRSTGAETAKPASMSKDSSPISMPETKHTLPTVADAPAKPPPADTISFTEQGAVKQASSDSPCEPSSSQIMLVSLKNERVPETSPSTSSHKMETASVQLVPLAKETEPSSTEVDCDKRSASPPPRHYETIKRSVSTHLETETTEQEKHSTKSVTGVNDDTIAEIASDLPVLSDVSSVNSPMPFAPTPPMPDGSAVTSSPFRQEEDLVRKLDSVITSSKLKPVVKHRKKSHKREKSSKKTSESSPLSHHSHRHQSGKGSKKRKHKLSSRTPPSSEDDVKGSNKTPKNSDKASQKKKSRGPSHSDSDKSSTSRGTCSAERKSSKSHGEKPARHSSSRYTDSDASDRHRPSAKRQRNSESGRTVVKSYSEIDRKSERMRERSRDKERRRSRDTVRERSRDTVRERSRDTVRERSRDTVRERSRDTERERSRETDTSRIRASSVSSSSDSRGGHERYDTKSGSRGHPENSRSDLKDSRAAESDEDLRLWEQKTTSSSYRRVYRYRKNTSRSSGGGGRDRHEAWPRDTKRSPGKPVSDDSASVLQGRIVQQHRQRTYRIRTDRW